jgi:hypothetical protein
MLYKQFVGWKFGTVFLAAVLRAIARTKIVGGAATSTAFLMWWLSV